MAPSFNSPKQFLEQSVCGQLGWSSRYFKDQPSGRWCVEVRWGVGASRRFVFVSNDVSEASIPGTKRGHAAAATVALHGLETRVREANAKVVQTVDDAFGPWFEDSCVVLDGAAPGTWERFWQCKPRVVGIDVEGNLQTPPVLVQVCVELPCESPQGSAGDFPEGLWLGSALCVLELPSSNPGGAISADLQRLLRDGTVTKVFCDGTADSDKKSLRLRSKRRDTYGRDVVDLETFAADVAGATSVPRGLARIIDLARPEASTRVAKDAKDKKSIHFFVDIQSKRKQPPECLRKVPASVRKYAAMDAWLTLLGYRLLLDVVKREGVSGV